MCSSDLGVGVGVGVGASVDEDEEDVVVVDPTTHSAVMMKSQVMSM